ncbi:MAG: cupin domain-containing protein [Chloroflexi bacterium]|nr:cupin domain-containing protein [Chloroflexota bacterium]
MMQVRRLVAGLALVVMGFSFAVLPAAADEPPLVLTLASQRIELLPPGPLCWDVFGDALPAGGRTTAPYAASAPFLSYALEGERRREYVNGPAVTAKAGEGEFTGAGNWFTLANPGTAPFRGIVFALSCERVPSFAGLTPIANTGPLAGFQPGQRPYVATLRTGRSGPGSQGPVVSHSGPVVYTVLEGETAISTAAGVTRYRQGDVFAIPAGTQYQYTNAGAGVNRSLYVFLTPADQPPTAVHTDVRLPQLAPAALPRTGEGAPWTVFSAMAGVALLATGIVGRRLRA